MRRLLAIAALGAIAATVVVSVGVPSAPAQEVATHGYTVQLIDSGAGELARAEGGELVLDPAAAVDPLQGDATCRLARLELATGIVTPLPAAASPEACAGDLAFAPDGSLYGLLQGSVPPEGTPIAELVRFDVNTGAATVVGQIGTFSALGGQSIVPFGGITFDGAGQLFVMLLALDEEGYDPGCQEPDVDIASCLYRIDDPNVPAATTLLGRVASIPVDTPGALGSTLAATCDTVYSTPITAVPEGDVIQLTESLLATVDTSSGTRADIGQFGAELAGWGADFDRAGALPGLVLDGSEMELRLFVASLDPTGGPNVATVGAEIEFGEFGVQGLSIEPLDCTPDPIVLEPTFTG